MSILSKRWSIKSSESANRHHIGRMDQLSNACERDAKLHPQTFRMGAMILVNGILKPYYHRFVSPKFPWI
jgi:hypothetical protein